MLTHILMRGRTDILTILWEGRPSVRSWLRAVEADLIMISNTTDKFADMREATLDRWIASFLQSGAKALEAIGAALAEHCKVLAPQEAVIVIEEELEQQDGTWRCTECNDLLPTYNALCVYTGQRNTSSLGRLVHES